MGIFWENSFAVFAFFTLVLGGGAAWMSGRAVASSWQPWWHAAAWMIPLAAAVQFLQSALHGNTLLSAHYYLVNLACLIAISALAHRATRARIIARQYGWLFQRVSPFTWRRHNSAIAAPAAGASTRGEA